MTTTRDRPSGRWSRPAPVRGDAWFPGRVIGGATLVLGPVVWAVGVLLRYLGLNGGTFSAEQLAQFRSEPFAAHSQLVAHQANPGLVGAGYALFALGALLLVPAFVTLARIIATRCPTLGCWGGLFVVLGLIGRLYHAGVDQTLFALAGTEGVDRAIGLVLSVYPQISYGPWRVPVTGDALSYLGVAMLAVGAFRSGTLGTGRVLLLLWYGTLWTGVLKGATLFDGVGSQTALCLVLVPLGIRVLRDAVPDLAPGRLPDDDRRPLRLLSW